MDIPSRHLGKSKLRTEGDKLLPAVDDEPIVSSHVAILIAVVCAGKSVNRAPCREIDIAY